ncbi:DUF2919 domain-containing protein [Pantoea sp. 1.19]|uniref:DUF2919 domain-containing protein n=1 Tax=Pantoea sp. 1.19 TaxID=1925589 RepID=UPI000948F5D3
MAAWRDTPDEYDDEGRRRLPLAFWLILLLQARTWLLLVMAGASREQGAALLALCYPDRHAFWLGLVAGVPAAVALWLSGLRQRWPRLWAAWRWVLLLNLLAVALLQGVSLWQHDGETMLATALLLLDLLALAWLAGSRRLRACFHPG